ncbi:MAG: hypothetical protein ACT4R6_08300 [Gemmatimonadaceae bacterium]
MKGLGLFALITAGIAFVGALIASRVIESDRAQAAVWWSAGLTVVVQAGTFLLARRWARTGQLLQGWGLGTLLRLSAVALYGWVGVRVLDLPLAPALLSFAAFVFVSTILEPLFLSQ